ncbi:MAG: hypothetical protein H8K10_10430 [Nitrospira sp.]|nr:hypothetical protein [Nitrospira sp.]
MTRYPLRRMGVNAVFLQVVLLIGVTAPVWAEEAGTENIPAIAQAPESRGGMLQQTQAPVAPTLPLLFAEGSNSCEIVSCGMGIKQTCQITCPADKTPKCSCDCERSIGPMCMDYKANCRCE